MYVQVEIELDTNPTNSHQKDMRTAARSLTNDRGSVHIFVPEDREKAIIAMFTIEKARQMDVVDKIGKRFYFVDGYSDCTIKFPKKAPGWYQPTAKRFTPKQRQYLAFIYYYTKINGRSPAQHEMQNYFQVTPAAVHNMVLALEKKGLISRIPRQPRSIKLLVSRAEIPDLA